ncbi:ribosomal protein S18-domain-containing protein [Helicostylum pulchrum]|uniref:Small ribosomal subunit protein bS18m n=1 Tax=Helicostylum pulchrum TaxID=562976 RepID=A0ABP9XXG8_9FUNG|nr:ribosomal protein S18-domain-containing protein [Helicostylum pulchrum]
MLAQVRAFSSISRVLRAPQLTTPVLSSQPINSTTSESTGNQKTIEEATLHLLEGTLQKDRVRPISEAVQRYQKIHREGDVYHPEDLNDTRYRESLRQRRGKTATPTEDPFEVLGLDPLIEYKNFRLLTHFVSDMGKILPRQQTGVSAKNQRKLAKAIKRARAMGLMSSTSNQYDFRV